MFELEMIMRGQKLRMMPENAEQLRECVDRAFAAWGRRVPDELERQLRSTEPAVRYSTADYWVKARWVPENTP